MEIPDQAARHKWAQLSALVENLFPAKNDPDSDMLPHDAEQAMKLERSGEDEVSGLSAPDRFIVSRILLRLRYFREGLRDNVIARKLGKPVREFEEEVKQEVTAGMQELVSSLTKARVRNEGKSDV